jgi:hypothetical protein
MLAERTASIGGVTLRAEVHLTTSEPNVALSLDWDDYPAYELPPYTLADFGIPRGTARPRRLKLPRRLAQDLRTGLESAPPGPVWLRLARPAGYLAAVPWESVNLARRTLLRLPDEMDVPQQVTGYRRLAIVACTAGGLISPVVDHIHNFTQRLHQRMLTPLEVHLFADVGVSRAITAMWRGNPALHVHGPAQLNESPLEAAGGPPFPLRRIAGVLGGSPAQAVHLVMPGAFDNDEPTLVVSGLDQRQDMSYAGEGAVKQLADSVGAPLISVTAAPGGDEVAARMVTDLVGATRPGPTVFAAINPATTVPLELAFAHIAIASDRHSGDSEAVIGSLVRRRQLFYYLQPEVFRLPDLYFEHLNFGLPGWESVTDGGWVQGVRPPWVGGVGLRAISDDPTIEPAGELPLWAAAAIRFVESRRAEINQRLAADPRRVDAYLSGASSALDDIQAFITHALGDPS